MTEERTCPATCPECGKHWNDPDCYNLAIVHRTKLCADCRPAPIVQTAVGQINKLLAGPFPGPRNSVDAQLRQILTALLAEKEREIETLQNLLQEEKEERGMLDIAWRDAKSSAEQAEAAVAQARDGIRFQLSYSTATPFGNVSGTEVETVIELGKKARRALSGSTDEAAGVK